MAIRKSSSPKFERLKDPILSRPQFVWRQIRYLSFAAIFVGGSLFFGICGYHFTENLSWLDSFLNAAMILGGMGPVRPQDNIVKRMPIRTALVKIIVRFIIFSDFASGAPRQYRF